jgi:hypothetical protein
MTHDHSQTADLLPCPFCGLKARLATFSNRARKTDGKPLVVISCDHSSAIGCCARIERFGVENATAAWNRRPSP